MRNTFGNNITVTLFGESHGEAIGAVLDGMKPGVKIDSELIRLRLSQRRGEAEISTKRREKDDFKIVSGVFNGFTTGDPICVIIENKDTKSSDYDEIRYTPRPSHADYTRFIKSEGFADYRGGGHSSGRLTAPLVAVGAICETVLREKGITVLSHIKQCGDICDTDFSFPSFDEKALSEAEIPVIDGEARRKIKEMLIRLKKAGDSIGATVETVIYGLPAGVGEPWFDTLEGTLAHAVFSVPAVKGIEFGAGFSLCKMLGSQANGSIISFKGEAYPLSRGSGSILGGISDGGPIVFRTAVKPTPSIALKQRSVNLKTKENTEIEIKGRHDPFIAHKASVAISAVTAITVLDALYS